MKETKTIAKAANFTAVDFGKMSEIKDYTFLHTHKNHEELYFFLSGKGEFQVDGEVFPIQEGSVVRVAPAGKRSVRNNGTEPLLMFCVQYRGATFTADDTIAADGVILDEKVEW